MLTTQRIANLKTQTKFIMCESLLRWITRSRFAFLIFSILSLPAFGLDYSQVPIPVGSTIVGDIELHPVSGDLYILPGETLYRSTNDGIDWTAALTLNSATAVAISSTGTILVASLGNGIRRSTNHGASWATVNSGLPINDVWNIAVRADGVFFAGTSTGLSKSTNDGLNWTSAGISSTSIDEIAFGSSTAIYAGSHWGTSGILVSTNDGASWVNITAGLDGSHRWGLAVAPNGDVYTGSDGNGIFRSTDQGQTWTQIGLPSYRFRSIAFMGDGTPLSGTEGGGVHAYSGGSSWVSQNSGLTSTEVFCIKKAADSRIWVGTVVNGGSGGLFVSCNPDQDPDCTPSSHHLAVYYVVPSNVTYDPMIHRRLIDATVTIQNWYRCATGGLTWTFALPETVQVYNGLQTREYYLTHGDWWGSLPAEMSASGKPIWTPGTIATLWAQGAGWWAGAAQSCGVDCGLAILGVEAFPEFNNPAYSGGTCPGGSGGAAWPCTPEGAFAHELGHTLGLPHPADIPQTAADAGHSVMQTHWNFPDYAASGELPWGFLTREIDILDGNPFMKSLPGVSVPNPSCDLVNLPSRSPQPAADFSFQANGSSNVDFLNLSQGATRYWWHFGDGTDSHSQNPNHTFPTAGNYIVTLQSFASNGMGAIKSTVVSVGCCDLSGDANNDGLITIADVVFIIQYVFAGGSAPICHSEGDPDCSGLINISDAVYLIQYIFGGGPAPCSACN